MTDISEDIAKFILRGIDTKNVIIIGGGPVGLYTGIIYKNKGYNVLIIEKDRDFSREWIFFLQNSPNYHNLPYLPETLLDRLNVDGCYIGAVPSQSLGTCFKTITPSLSSTERKFINDEMLCDNEFGYKYQNNENDLVNHYPLPLAVSIMYKDYQQLLFDEFTDSGGLYIKGTQLFNWYDIYERTGDLSLKNEEIEYTIDSSNYNILIGATGVVDPIKTQLIRTRNIQVFNLTADILKDTPQIIERIRPSGANNVWPSTELYIKKQTELIEQKKKIVENIKKYA